MRVALVRRVLTAATALAATAIATGCGSTASSDWVPSDVDEQATIAQLGDAGYTRLCAAFDDYVRDMYRSQLLVKAACTAHALDTTADAVACGAAVEECLSDLPAPVEEQLTRILAQASCAVVDVEVSGCQSKVSALKSCLDALGEAVDALKLSATCAAFGSPVPSDWWVIDEPAACSALRTGCPL